MTDTDNKQTLLTMAEVADYFGASVGSVRRWTKQGLPCLRPSPGVVRFELDAVLDWCRDRNEKRGQSHD